MASEIQYITYQQAKDLFATKEDLARLEARLIWKIAGLQIGSMVAIAAILRFLA